MKFGYVIKTLLICCSAFLIVFTGFLTTKLFKNKKNIAKEELEANDYYKKISLKPKYKSFSHIARIEISIKDEGFSPNGKIVDVSLNETKILLQPADARYRRGSAVLQLTPNIYTIKWIVKNQGAGAPVFVEHKKEVNITDQDLWMHIHIEGSKITFS